MATLLAVNPHARSGKDLPPAVLERLRSLGRIHHVNLDGEQALSRAIEQHGERLQRVVIGGGDGTLQSSLGSLRQTNLPLGVLPLGTANDFARSLGVPQDPEAAIGVIETGHTRRVGLGEVNDTLFLNAVGVGLGPRLNRALDRETKKRLGVFAYLKRFFDVYSSRFQESASLRLDGKRRRTRYLQITIGNGIHYGGGMTLSRDARLDDGQLVVLCLAPQPWWSLMARFFTLRVGPDPRDQDQRGMKLFKARQVEVRTRRAMDVTADGELVTQTPLVCRVLPDALTVYAPPDSRKDARS